MVSPEVTAAPEALNAHAGPDGSAFGPDGEAVGPQLGLAPGERDLEPATRLDGEGRQLDVECELAPGESLGHGHFQGQPSQRLPTGLAHDECALTGAGRQVADERDETQGTEVCRKGCCREDLDDVLKGDVAVLGAGDAPTDEECMQDRRGIGSSHGGAGYPRRSRLLRSAALLGLLLALAGSSLAQAAPRPSKLLPRGSWRSFTIKGIGQKKDFYLETLSGCTYRVSVEARTLAQAEVELYAGAAASPRDAARTGAEGGIASLVFHAEGDGAVLLRAGGFSASTGRGRIRVETLDWDGESTGPNRRLLGPRRGDEGARVGELLLGETNTWELVGSPGTAYEVITTRGTAGGVRLVVKDGEGATLATSDPWRAAGEHFPIVRFTLPEPAGPRKPAVLEVEGVWSCAGTYGVMLRPLKSGATLEPGDGVQPDAPLIRGLVEGEPYAFRLEEGDMAVLWLPDGTPVPQRQVERKLRARWISAVTHGEIARGQRPGAGNFTSFRPHQAGTYRVRPLPGATPKREGATLKLYKASDLGPAPVHMGTGGDPIARARLTGRWKTIGLGICVPGVPYLFVTREGANAGMGMRVTTLDGAVLATRPTSGPALTQAPGYGPSLRFRVETPQVVRLQARGGRRVVRALLRELQNPR